MRFNFRILFFPFSVIYAMITDIRNFLYDKNILSTTNFEVPIINVGNLSLGGSGKTPQIEYLIRLLKNDYKIAVISRGYKRKTKGFIVADNTATPKSIGDEPYQIYKKFKDITIAVGENRAIAIRKVLDNFSPDVILLDDAFQHRRVKAGLNLLLTPYSRPFYHDFVFPSGHLRESRKNAKRADIVIVTKSPKTLESAKKTTVISRIHEYVKCPVFFSNIEYSKVISGQQNSINIEDLTSFNILLITGIANPEPLYSFLSEKNINFESLKFADHHHFSNADIKSIKQKFAGIKAEKKLILTTEKDYVRLAPHFNNDLYYLPIQTQIAENVLFNKKILDYVRGNQ